MGLDDFSTSDNNTASSIARQSTRQGSQTTEEQDGAEEDDEPFKVVSGDKGRKKVFPTEEDWEETVEFIENEMGMSVGEVMNKSAGDRYQLLHQAILQRNGGERPSFHPTKECAVCGEEFVFPENWNFTRIRTEVVCNSHKIGQVMEEIGAINALKV